MPHLLGPDHPSRMLPVTSASRTASLHRWPCYGSARGGRSSLPPSRRRPARTCSFSIEKTILVGGLEHEFYFSIYWEFHHPIWLSYFSRLLEPPTRKKMLDLDGFGILAMILADVTGIEMGMQAYASSGCEKVGIHKLILVGWRMMVTYVWLQYPHMVGEWGFHTLPMAVVAPKRNHKPDGQELKCCVSQLWAIVRHFKNTI